MHARAMVRLAEWSSITFGEHLKRTRHARGLTQEQAANLAGMHPANLRRIERGAANPSLSTMARLAVALEVNLADLVRGIPRQQD